ncbi:DUF6223 family protein [Streptomyces sp. NPDC050585]|uniref:DUF6223 family protein n=1 Tax=Streptomyces sp. NPDC050585 TaxID=3365632 RepID=UPI003787B59E
MSVTLEFAVPAAAHLAVQPFAADVYTMGPGRLAAAAAALAGLVGVVAGALALARATGRTTRGDARTGALVAWAAGAVAVAAGVAVVVTAEGGLGTGNGLGGGVVAALLGLSGAALGHLARSRTGSRRQRSAAGRQAPPGALARPADTGENQGERGHLRVP